MPTEDQTLGGQRIRSARAIEVETGCSFEDALAQLHAWLSANGLKGPGWWRIGLRVYDGRIVGEQLVAPIDEHQERSSEPIPGGFPRLVLGPDGEEMVAEVEVPLVVPPPTELVVTPDDAIDEMRPL